MQSPADKACVLGCELPVSRAEGVFSFAVCIAPHILRSLLKSQAPGHCDLMSYNRVIFEVLLPLFQSCLVVLHIFKHSTKDQKSPKAVGSYSLLSR